MQPKWGNLWKLKSSMIASSKTTNQLVSFHSTPSSREKWKNKWTSDIRGQQPSKSYIRYSIRQKRADAKKALKDFIFNYGSSKASSQKLEGKCNLSSNTDYRSEKGQPKSSWRSGKSHQKINRKYMRECFCEDSGDNPGTIFQATFGNRWSTWTFLNWRGSSFAGPDFEFEWREKSNWSNARTKRSWNDASSPDSDGESYSVGSRSDRTILGLPPTGLLKIEDVKTAFRLSALKWHPDKHQGSSQAMAEEKFKVCVNAYKSLCSALSPA